MPHDYTGLLKPCIQLQYIRGDNGLDRREVASEMYIIYFSFKHTPWVFISSVILKLGCYNAPATEPWCLKGQGQREGSDTIPTIVFLQVQKGLFLTRQALPVARVWGTWGASLEGVCGGSAGFTAAQNEWKCKCDIGSGSQQGLSLIPHCREQFRVLHWAPQTLAEGKAQLGKVPFAPAATRSGDCITAFPCAKT